MPQKKSQQLQLAKTLPGKSQGVPQGEAGIDSPGRLDFAADLQGEGNGDGGNPIGLKGALDQSHGLVAQASARRQNCQIDTIAFQGPCHFPGGTVHQCIDVWWQHMTHK